MTTAPLTVPGAPTIITITPGKGNATLTLTPPDNTGGGAIVSYAARCNSSGYLDRSAAASVETLVVRGLKGGVLYSCTATANNGSFAGPASAAKSVTPLPGGAPMSWLMMLLD